MYVCMLHLFFFFSVTVATIMKKNTEFSISLLLLNFERQCIFLCM